MVPLYMTPNLPHQFSSNIENIPPSSLKKLQMIANPKKPSASLVKPAKNTNHSIRAGDWICLLCNNLNFSFRNECNRCQKQTKKQNYIQNLMLLNEDPKVPKQMPNNKIQRKPLADLTNLYQNNASFEKPIEPHFEKEKSQNYYGFENVLLLTPPKSFADVKLRNKYNNYPTHNNILPFNSPNSETNKKIIKPYNSPQEIPSISPILKSDLLRGNSRGEEVCARNLSEFLCEKIFEDSHEDELGCSNEDNRDEPIERIFSKIMEDDSFSQKNNLSNMNNSRNSASMMKENEHNNLLNSLIGFMQNTSYLPFNNSSNSLKDLRGGKKKNKNKGLINENERKSDWYCLNCNNLNYSFRIVCNRCQAMKATEA